MELTPNDKVECPICMRKFDKEVIEAHAGSCVGLREKPLTRNKKKSPVIFFHKKNLKRSKDGDLLTTNSKKKIKYDESKEEEEEEDTSEKVENDDDNFEDKKEKSVDDSEINCHAGESFSKDKKFSSFFEKRTSKLKEKEFNDENSKKESKTIDLTTDVENSKNLNSEDNSDNLIINTGDENNVDGEAESSFLSLSPNILSKRTTDYTSSHSIHRGEITEGLEINEKQSCLKDENYLSQRKGFQLPKTTFQQELLDISIASGNFPSSPPVLSNSRDRKAFINKEDQTCINKNSTIVKVKVKDIKDKTKFKLVLGKKPLSELMRPKTLDDFVGQVALGTQKLLKELLYNDRIPSLVFWGPPGCGKSSLAHIISQRCNASQQYRYVALSALMSGVKDIKEEVKIAKNEKRLRQKQTILFIDEVHRFNKMQQDSFLPHIEDGTITFIGATTENPSFHLNNALISRCRVVVLNPLNEESIMKILRNAVTKLGGIEKTDQLEQMPHSRFILEDGVVQLLANFSNGDARKALSSLDMFLQAKLKLGIDSCTENENIPIITCDQIKEELKFGSIYYDRNGDEHYNIISAFQKSIRGSNQDAAVYWLARMIEGGEDPLFIARRLIVIASEDIGMGDSNGLNLAVSCYQACQIIGMPECSLNLAHVTTYLANAPKSVASYSAYKKATGFIKEYNGSQPAVPLHLRNAPTKIMRELGYGKGYKYPPDFENGGGEQDYLPEEIVRTKFFT